jgi:hypothetical protein
MLAITDFASGLSLCGQILALALAAVLGRFWLRSRNAIWLASFAGALGAMAANILVDGQGAFLLLVYAPVVYFVAVIGRRDLNRRGRA